MAIVGQIPRQGLVGATRKDRAVRATAIEVAMLLAEEVSFSPDGTLVVRSVVPFAMVPVAVVVAASLVADVLLSCIGEVVVELVLSAVMLLSVSVLAWAAGVAVVVVGAMVVVTALGSASYVSVTVTPRPMSIWPTSE
eukprot:CAMPEP_0170644936 /NCGR_PEP_ID=MMETSP0224-20130122/42777_1 /TAXON_ID=285029 /ORGANISM="Togula jolla, Strain CCCM 725" /LENGTH=137 /DNA_ID=CAMNT_0010976049 /DNA_START=220 /DNA_END=634 /DNA_ORIENTATION=-